VDGETSEPLGQEPAQKVLKLISKPDKSAFNDESMDSNVLTLQPLKRESTARGRKGQAL
jgi:hypothetical protein